MKPRLVLLLVILVSTGSVSAIYFSAVLIKILPQSSTASSCNDPGSISHVHNPGRLIIVKSCITASGNVSRVFMAGDGNYDVRIKLDPPYGNLTNLANERYQQGDLVVEIVCAQSATDTSARIVCQNYTNRIPLPSVGKHVTVTGPYVLDSWHGNWAEIHPVYSLVISPS